MGYAIVTAIQDRLFVGLISCLEFTGQSLLRRYALVSVNADPPVDTNITVRINWPTEDAIVYNTGATPTTLTVAAGITGAITGAAIAGITAVNNGDGTFSISGASDYELKLDDYLDILPQSAIELTLSNLLVIAKQMADSYCANGFYEHDDDGYLLDAFGDKCDETAKDPAPADIPEAVRFGVISLLKYLYNEYNDTSGGGSSVPAGPVSSRKVGDISVSYENAAGGSSWWENAYGLLSLAKNALSQYRVTPFGFV